MLHRYTPLVNIFVLGGIVRLASRTLLAILLRVNNRPIPLLVE